MSYADDGKGALERMSVLDWTARIGAVTAEALAHRGQTTVGAARARLVAARRAGLLERHRPLAGRPALYTVTRAGLRECGSRGLEPSRVSASNAGHLIAAATAAAVLERAYPDHRVVGERELRRDERAAAGALLSARMDRGPDGARRLHRPDLALWPLAGGAPLPVAVEVELTAKAPRRLFEICRAWARCRSVAGVIYLVAPEVERPLMRAIAKASAGDRIAAVPLAALAADEDRGRAASSRTVASGA
jgi:hypothetical protein